MRLPLIYSPPRFIRRPRHDLEINAPPPPNPPNSPHSFSPVREADAHVCRSPIVIPTEASPAHIMFPLNVVGSYSSREAVASGLGSAVAESHRLSCFLPSSFLCLHCTCKERRFRCAAASPHAANAVAMSPFSVVYAMSLPHAPHDAGSHTLRRIAL
jgi:hypothetical protein